MTRRSLRHLESQMMSGPELGSRWRLRKDNSIVEVTGAGVGWRDDQPRVVFMRPDERILWVATLAEWCEMVHCEPVKCEAV